MADKKIHKILLKTLKESEYCDTISINDLICIGTNKELYFMKCPKEYYYVFNIKDSIITKYHFKQLISNNVNIVFNILSFEKNTEIPITVIFNNLVNITEEKNTKLSYKGESIKVEKRWKYNDYIICAGLIHADNTLNSVYSVSRHGNIIAGFVDRTNDFDIIDVHAYMNNNIFIISNNSFIIYFNL